MGTGIHDGDSFGDFLYPYIPDPFPLRNQNFLAQEAMTRVRSFVILEEWRNSD